jgi:signal transduction histidine kinase
VKAAAGPSFGLKLTILMTVVSGLAAAVVAGALVVLEVNRVLHDAIEAVSAQGRVTAANSTAALDFDDKDAARATLAGLAAVPEFTVAEIRKPDGSLFARYERSAERAAPALHGGVDVRVDGRWLELSEPIARDHEVIGTLALLYDLAPARRRSALAVAVAAALTAGVIVLSWFAARRLQRSLLRPVRELAGAAERIAQTGDYDVRAKKLSDDELGVLTEVFNDMIARINEAELLRRDHQAMLEREVERRTAEVVDAQSRLRHSERMASLGTLSAGLGHDIGNILMPLRAHLSAIHDMVDARAPSNGQHAEDHFAALAKATEYLQNLSAGLRLMAQDPERAGHSRERLRLTEWWGLTQPLLRAVVGSGIALEHDLPEALPPIKMSKHLLTQAILNLVQNAARAMTPGEAPPKPGAEIRVWARRVQDGETGPRVEIGVTDNGPGMTDEVMRRCMEPYFTTGTRRISSGLGLTLVKGIVERTGGALLVQSRLGEGTTFTFHVPAAAESAAPAASAVVTIAEPRRRAIVTHILESMNFRVQSGVQSEVPPDRGSDDGVWLADSADQVSPAWAGRIIVLGDSSPSAAAAAGRVLVLDPSTPVPKLRRAIEQLFPGS